MKRILLVTNLFPRPDQPRRGVFNASFARALHALLSAEGGGLDVVVPVPEWRNHRRREIRQWRVPPAAGDFPGCSVGYVPCFHIPGVGRSLAWRFHLAALRAACRKEVEKCDAVLGSWLYPDAVAAQHLASEVGRPCWIRLHGTDRFHLDDFFRGAVCRQALSASPGILVNADFMRNELVRRGIPEDRICVVPNGIDRSVFFPGDSRQRERHVLLWAGNLVDIKRPELALRTLATMPEGREVPQLVMAGEGLRRGRLERLAVRLGLADRVAFVGSLDRRELADRMRRAGALLLTSRSEGMPNVVIEALACGLPVVSTAAGDVPRIVHPGRNGFVVEAGGEEETVRSLADALWRAIETEWDPVAISGGIAHHDWSHSAKTVLNTMNSAERGRHAQG